MTKSVAVGPKIYKVKSIHCPRTPIGMLLYKSFVSSADLGAKLITLDKVLTLAV